MPHRKAKYGQFLNETSVLIVGSDPKELKSISEVVKGSCSHILHAHSAYTALKILAEANVGVLLCRDELSDAKAADLLKKVEELSPHTVGIIMADASQNIEEELHPGQEPQVLDNKWTNTILQQTVTDSIEKHHLLLRNRELQELAETQLEELTQSHRLLWEQVQIGAKIHDVLLAGKTPSIPGIDIYSESIPCQEIDGDFFEFFHPTSHIFDLVVGDIMGKGLPAALVATAMKTQITRYALPFARVHVFQKEGFWEEDLVPIKQILLNVHEALGKQLIDLEFFGSLFFTRFN